MKLGSPANRIPAFSTLALAVIVGLIAVGLGLAAVPAEHRMEWAKQPYDPTLCVLYHGDRAVKQVCLTIDDGPNPDTTPGLLKILKDRKVKATFFLQGRRAQEFPALVRAIVADGHEIGNHTMEHDRLTGLDHQEIMNDLEKGRDAVQAAGEVKVALFRPPGGSMSDDVYAVAGELGYTTVLWTDTANDWTLQPPKQIVDRVLSRVQPGSIIVLHDGKTSTVDALPAILDGLRKKGYTTKMAGEWAVRLRLDSKP